MPSARPKILFLAHRVPYPPNRGDRIRSYHLIRFLAERADVYLAFLSEEVVPETTTLALNQFCKGVIHSRLGRIRRWLNGALSIVAGRTATEGLFRSILLRRQLVKLRKDLTFDSIFVFCSSMVQYAQTSGDSNTAIVIDLVDVDSQKWFDYANRAWGPKRWLLRLEGKRLRKLESSLPERASAIMVVTDQEADVYQSFRPDYRPLVVRNGVDLDYFQPPLQAKHDTLEPPGQVELHNGTFSRNHPHRIVFVGALDYHANVDGAAWFCKHVWPRLREKFPDATFRLVGSRPSAKAINLGTIAGIDVVGQVDDVRPYLQDSDVVIVPLLVARGLQNKVLEALAAGRPTVVSAAALEGIGAQPEQHLLLAETQQEWVDQITRLFESALLRETIASGGRDFVSREYRWSARLKPLSSIPGLLETQAT